MVANPGKHTNQEVTRSSIVDWVHDLYIWFPFSYGGGGGGGGYGGGGYEQYGGGGYEQPKYEQPKYEQPKYEQPNYGYNKQSYGNEKGPGYYGPDSYSGYEFQCAGKKPAFYGDSQQDCKVFYICQVRTVYFTVVSQESKQSRSLLLNR